MSISCEVGKRERDNSPIPLNGAIYLIGFRPTDINDLTEKRDPEGNIDYFHAVEGNYFNFSRD